MSEGQTQQPEGRAAVRVYLIERLTQAGFVRPKGMTAESFEKQMVSLERRLAYLPARSLQDLADSLIDSTTGVAWPPENWIMQVAEGMKFRPVEEIGAMSWFTSVEGPRELSAGLLVEVYRAIRKNKRPPTQFERRAMRAIADANASMIQRAKEQEGAGLTLAAHVQRDVDEWRRDHAAALALVEQGNKKREGTEQ